MHSRGPRSDHPSARGAPLLSPDERFENLGLTLPEIPTFPTGQEPRLDPVTVHGSLAFISGIGPLGTVGIVGADIDVDGGYAAARATALLVFRRIVDAFGTLDAVERWIKVVGFVRSARGFGDQPAVVNGFSDLVITVYGSDRGRCARSAIGVSELPAGIPVEFEAVIAPRSDARLRTTPAP
jgi:enamine deaminase RidA (YjgF/YER057c/UK114 family)